MRARKLQQTSGPKRSYKGHPIGAASETRVNNTKYKSSAN